ncbi:MAG: NAD-dependent epimerase/dehydratase family protein [Solirubrobacteraceae bacterium]
MSRVLITGGAGLIGAAVAMRLLSDPAYDVRVADEREVPLWMREGCEIRSGDLRVPAQAQAAVKGCSAVIHLAGLTGREAATVPHTRLEYENALHNAVIGAALERKVERFVYVSSPRVFERAQLHPTPENHLAECPAPTSAAGFSRLTGEHYCRAAQEQHGLAFTICRPSATYGPTLGDDGEPGVDGTLIKLFEGALSARQPLTVNALSEQTLTPTHVDDVAPAIALALASPAAVNEDFNLCASRELSVAEIARMLWLACGGSADDLALETAAAGANGAEPARSWPSAEKAFEVLGWRAQIDFEDGAAATVAAQREAEAAARRIGSAV